MTVAPSPRSLALLGLGLAAVEPARAARRRPEGLGGRRRDRRVRGCADPPLLGLDPRRPGGRRLAGRGRPAGASRASSGWTTWARRPTARPPRPEPDLRPTRENLDWAVDDWLGPRVRPGRRRGDLLRRPGGRPGPRPGDAGRPGLPPADRRPGGRRRRDRLVARGRPGPGRDLAGKARVVIWLDTSLRGRGDRGPGPGEGGADSGSDWLRALTRWPGVTAWLAADGRPAPEDGAVRRRAPQGDGHARAGPQPARLPDGAPRRPGPGRAAGSGRWAGSARRSRSGRARRGWSRRPCPS